MSKTVRSPSFKSILFLSILVSFVNSGKDNLVIYFCHSLINSNYKCLNYLFPASIIVKRDVDEHTDLLGEAFSDKSRNFDVMLVRCLVF